MFGLTAYSQSPYSTLGGDILLGVGDVTANASVSAIGYRIQFGSGDITENQLNKLKENNTDNNLFMELEVMSTESERWDLYKGLKNKDAIMESIQDFMFSFQIRNKEDIDKFLIQANETSLALFKKDKAFIKDYVETPEMSGKEKMKDIELMIENFIEQERYEDCALLVKIKENKNVHIHKIII